MNLKLTTKEIVRNNNLYNSWIIRKKEWLSFSKYCSIPLFEDIHAVPVAAKISIIFLIDYWRIVSIWDT